MSREMLKLVFFAPLFLLRLRRKNDELETAGPSEITFGRFGVPFENFRNFDIFGILEHVTFSICFGRFDL